MVFNKFDAYVADVHHAKHNHASDVHKVLLTNVAPVRTNSVKADITEIAAGNGYVAGGNIAPLGSSSQTNGTYKLLLSNPATWQAASGDMATFRYAVLYNDTATGKPLIGWFDYGVAIPLHVAETFQVQFDQTNGVLTDA